MPTHKVFRLHGQSSHHDLKQAEETIPIIDKYEVLIRIRAVTLNYRDYAMAHGKYPFPVKDQVIPCSDAAGDIVQVGSMVEGLKVGDRVIGTFDVSNIYGHAARLGPRSRWSY